MPPALLDPRGLGGPEVRDGMHAGPWEAITSTIRVPVMLRSGESAGGSSEALLPTVVDSVIDVTLLRTILVDDSPS